ncbi:hypothetical protein Syun_028569 [Stephania yunnanensis]|uniref:Pectin acetylesterase n=1 Tax=Stephania yunnanensis TaxID=152371 RepID=A0AAP0HKL3_9MAGN
MEKVLPFVGILSDKPDENPDFYNWNRVKLRYCDGASFSGEGHDEASQLYLRGKRIWLAGMEDLMAKGMHNADQALLSGQSAGALASMLTCDDFRELFPATTKVKCLSDAGLFLDAKDVSGGHTLRNMFASIVRLHMVQKNLLQSCTSRLDPTSCFLPQNYIDDIKTPLFLLNSAYDAWQILECLAPPAADPNNDWHNCKLDHMQCNTSQIQFLQGFRNQMLDAIEGFSKSKKNGVFINSCFAHVQTERKGMWFAYNSPMIGNKRVAETIGDWYFGRTRHNIAIDCPYPCDNTCQNIAVEHGDGSLHTSM